MTTYHAGDCDVAVIDAGVARTDDGYIAVACVIGGHRSSSRRTTNGRPYNLTFSEK